MHADIEAVLALQADDVVIQSLEARLAAFEPQLLDLDRQRQVAADALARAEGAVLAEERKQKDLQNTVGEHKLLHERNVHQLDAVRRMREATAAQSQVEQARRMLAEEESTLQGISRQLQELRHTVDVQRKALGEMDIEQQSVRASLAGERSAIEASLDEARKARSSVAAKVPGSLLQKYDRIHGRRHGEALFPLRGQSCGCCDTALPLQRRSVMQRSGAIEVCEGCGVLLYAEN